jgi:hypothetical protein
MVRHTPILDSTFNYPKRCLARHRHPELRQLVFSPLEEQTALRGDTIGKLKAQVLTADKIVSLGLPPMLGNQSELNVSFARPAAVRTNVGCKANAVMCLVMISHVRLCMQATTISVEFMADRADNRSGSGCSIAYLPPPADSAVVDCDGYKHQLKLSSSGTSIVYIACGLVRAVQSDRAFIADKTIEIRVFVDNVFSEGALP